MFDGRKIARWARFWEISYQRWGSVLAADVLGTDLTDWRYRAALFEMLEAASHRPLVIMCSEGDPALCHRTYEIGASLLIHHGVVVRSILRDGREEDVTDTLARVDPSRMGPEIRRRIGIASVQEARL